MISQRTALPSISEALLREGALELLASSTIGRYERESRRLARESGLASEMRGNAELLARVQSRLLVLLEDVGNQALRAPSEFEAAILLCALVDAGALGLDDDARDVLQRAAESPSPWIRSLAARLTAPITGPAPLHEPTLRDLAVAQ